MKKKNIFGPQGELDSMVSGATCKCEYIYEGNSRNGIQQPRENCTLKCSCLFGANPVQNSKTLTIYFIYNKCPLLSEVLYVSFLTYVFSGCCCYNGCFRSSGKRQEPTSQSKEEGQTCKPYVSSTQWGL